MQIFVAINTQLLNCGQPINPVVPLSTTVFAAGAFALVADPGTSAVSIQPAGVGAAADFLLVAFSPLVSGGRNFVKTFWQVAVLPGNVAALTNYFAAYCAQFGTLSAGSKIFCKITPVNQYGVTGVPVIQQVVVGTVYVFPPMLLTASAGHLVTATWTGGDRFDLEFIRSADGGVTWDSTHFGLTEASGYNGDWYDAGNLVKCRMFNALLASNWSSAVTVLT